MRSCMARYPTNGRRCKAHSLGRGPLAQRFYHPVDADDRPEDLDDDRGKIPFENQRYEDQHRADQIGERVAPILGAKPALLIGEIGCDKHRRPGEADDVIWLYVYPHRPPPAAAASPRRRCSAPEDLIRGSAAWQVVRLEEEQVFPGLRPALHATDLVHELGQ